MLRRTSLAQTPLKTRRVHALRSRALSTAPRAARPLLGRYNKTPMVLYRVQNGEKVILREHSEQMKLKRTSFDLKLGADGLVHPALGPNFIGPNGASLRPAGFVFGEIVANFRGPRMRIIEIPSGVDLPKELMLLHEHSDHYSLQTSEKRTLRGMHYESPLLVPTSPRTELNAILTAFMKPFPVLTKEAYFKRHPMDAMLP